VLVANFHPNLILATKAKILTVEKSFQVGKSLIWKYKARVGMYF
jgi:hypothetical protein